MPRVAAGEHVNETRVTRELQLSRSPAREALRILEAEGLVTLRPHRGAHVCPTTSEHEAILATVANGDLDGAVDELTAHITSLKDGLLKRRIAG